MRQLQLLLLVVLVGVLSVIAWQLQQIRRELTPFAALTHAVVLSATAPPETPAQHDERLRREMRRLMHDADVSVDEAFKSVSGPSTRTTAKAPSSDRPPRQ